MGSLIDGSKFRDFGKNAFEIFFPKNCFGDNFKKWSHEISNLQTTPKPGFLGD